MVTSWNVTNNFKAELKLIWTKHCGLATGSNDNDDAHSTNILFIIKDTKLHVPVVSQNNQSKTKTFISKELQRSVYWNGNKTKSENKNTANEYILFLESNLVGVNRLFVLLYSNNENVSKMYSAFRYYLRKGTNDNYNVTINEKNLFLKPTDWVWYKTIQRNKKINNSLGLRLYYRVFVRLLICKK